LRHGFLFVRARKQRNCGGGKKRIQGWDCRSGVTISVTNIKEADCILIGPGMNRQERIETVPSSGHSRESGNPDLTNCASLDPRLRGMSN